MIWQDLVLTFGGLIFTVTLFPMLYDVAIRGHPVNLWTSGLTTLVLFAFNVTYATMGCWLAAIPHTAAMWGLIWYYSYEQTRKDVNVID